MNRFFGHLHTITKHRHLVMRHCFRAGIPWRGLMHDLSKYSPAEFIPGVKFYTGTKSPTDGERRTYGYSKAWMHHKGRNRHHYEYWTDYSIVLKKSVPMKMPLVYVIEMFCDRVAACKVYLKDKYTDSSALEYYNRRLGQEEMHEETSALLGTLVMMLAEKGEKETFRYIRRELRKQKTY
ncbi:MAG: catalase [Spirochaetales bacterium]|nr:catalase [Spirochaetales bacterium]